MTKTNTLFLQIYGLGLYRAKIKRLQWQLRYIHVDFYICFSANYELLHVEMLSNCPIPVSANSAIYLLSQFSHEESVCNFNTLQLVTWQI